MAYIGPLNELRLLNMLILNKYCSLGIGTTRPNFVGHTRPPVALTWLLLMADRPYCVGVLVIAEEIAALNGEQLWSLSATALSRPYYSS